MQACTADLACLQVTVCIFMRVQPSVFLDRSILKQVVKCEAAVMMAAAGGLAAGRDSPSGPSGSRKRRTARSRGEKSAVTD